MDIVAGLTKGVIGDAVGTVTGLFSSVITANVAADLQSFQQSSYFRNPTIPPNPAVIIDMWNRGFIGSILAKETLQTSGINTGSHDQTPRLRNFDKLWNTYKDYSKERPSVSFLMGLWGKGYWEQSSAEAKQLIERAGGKADVWERYVTAMYEIPPVSVLMEGRLRSIIGDNELDEGLRRHGYGFNIHRRLYTELLKVNPPATDWIHFAVKEALSPQLANQVRLYDEFPRDINQYMHWHGLNWSTGIGIVADGVAREARIADLYWAAHWQPISPGQAFDMFHVLRANRLDRYRQAGLNPSEFTFADVERWLRINDYPPGVRDNLAALSFTPLRLVDIRQAIAFNYRATNDIAFRAALPQELQQRFDRYNRAWAIEQFRDRGVLPADAEVQVDLVIASVLWQQQGPVRNLERGAARRLFTHILKGYAAGIIPEENARRLLQIMGMGDAAISTYISIENGNRDLDNAKDILSAANRGYMHGGISEIEYRDALASAGMDAITINRYLARLNAKRDISRIQATTAKIVGWTAQGYLTVDQARTRLENLGWLDPDTTLLLAEANSRNLRLQGQAIRAADAARSKRARELEKALKQAQKNVELLQAAIRRQTPISTMQRHVKKGLISQQQFLDRAVRAGYPLDVAQTYLQDALTVNPPNRPTQTPTTASQPQSPQTTPPATQTTPAVAQAPNEAEQASENPPGNQVERPDTTLIRPDTTLPPP